MGVGMLDGAKNMAIIALDVEGADAIQSQSDESKVRCPCGSLFLRNDEEWQFLIRLSPARHH
jgi:hypothetical protein